MDENGLFSDIFETRYFGTTRCIVLNTPMQCEVLSKFNVQYVESKVIQTYLGPTITQTYYEPEIGILDGTCRTSGAFND